MYQQINQFVIFLFVHHAQMFVVVLLKLKQICLLVFKLVLFFSEKSRFVGRLGLLVQYILYRACVGFCEQFIVTDYCAPFSCKMFYCCYIVCSQMLVVVLVEISHTNLSLLVSYVELGQFISDYLPLVFILVNTKHKFCEKLGGRWYHVHAEELRVIVAVVKVFCRCK